MESEDPPKRRNVVATKARILAAAIECFGRRGYTEASIRDIAAAASVNSALLARYFGSKAGLFRAALTDSIQLHLLKGVERSNFGKVVLSNFVNSRADVILPTLALVVTAEEEPLKIIHEVHRELIIPAIARYLGPPNATERAKRILMLCAGFTIYQNQFSSGGSTLDPNTADWLACSLQRIVDDE